MTNRNGKILGLILLLCMVGCGPQSINDPPKGGDKVPVKEDHDHDHGPGPHGGTVIDFGKYHAEFCVDHAKKTATFYILDGRAKKAVPIAADKLLLSIKTPQFQVEMAATPQGGDPKGKCSRFVATHDNFGKEQEFEGTVSGTIDGKNYLGDFKEEAHDHKDEKKSE